jgi:hypothetical protein
MGSNQPRECPCHCLAIRRYVASVPDPLNRTASENKFEVDTVQRAYTMKARSLCINGERHRVFLGLFVAGN